MSDQYLYESDSLSAPTAVRTRGDAAVEARTFLLRLKVADTIVDRLFPENRDPTSDLDANDKDARRLLLRYATDVPLNILWYKRALRSRQTQRATWAVLTTIVGLVTIALPLLALRHHGPQVPTDAAAVAAQLSLIATALGSGWKFLGNLNDTKQRIGIFWKAFADLQEKLLTFEDLWHGKTCEGDKLTEVFLADVRRSLVEARAVARTEREAFFGTYKTPDEILQAAKTASTEVIAARDTLVHAQAAVVPRTREEMEKAVKEKAAAEEVRGKILDQAAIPDSRLDAEAQKAVVDAARVAYRTAKTERLEAQARLDSLTKP